MSPTERPSADVVERLTSEFEATVELSVIVEVVRQADADLTGQTPPAAYPELLERLARARLRGLAPDSRG